MPRRFTLQRALGAGSFGEVFLAEVRDDEDFVQTLAVKRLRPRWSTDAQQVQRLKDEARLLGLLHHEHIVRVLGLTRIEGRLSILMEPITGIDLSVVGRQVPTLSPRAALEVVAAVADALDAAWRTAPPGQSGPLRVVHRDIKPSNVMVTPRGLVKVMDFGVARATFDTREARTRSEQFGTARYMAPERWLDGVAEAPSDVFSLGVTLLELASGADLPRLRLSRQGFEEDLAEALAGLASWPGVAELCASMCRFEPQERPSAAEVRARARALAADNEGPGLRAWAEAHVPQAPLPDAPDVLPTGTVLEEDGDAAVTAPPRAAVSVRQWGVLTGLLGVAGLLIWWLTPPPPDAVEQLPEPVEVAEEAPAEVAEAPAMAAPEQPTVGAAVPASEPVPSPRRAAPEPTVDPVPSPVAAPTVPVTFVVAGQGLSVRTPHGVVRGRRHALSLPARTAVRIEVTEGSRTWPCTIDVGLSPSTVVVRGEADGGCSQEN